MNSPPRQPDALLEATAVFHFSVSAHWPLDIIKVPFRAPSSWSMQTV
jgi:hypothetical protein